MQQMIRAENFMHDVSARLPMELLASKYPAEEVQHMLEAGKIFQTRVLDYMLEYVNRKSPPGWNRAFFLWFLRVAPVHLDHQQMIWGYSFSPQDTKCPKVQSLLNYPFNTHIRFSCSLVDWVCISAALLPEAVWMLDYLLREGYKGHHGLDWCLSFSEHNEGISRRLLDAGAGLEWLFESPGTEFANKRLELNAKLRGWHASRLRRRQQCWAILGSWRYGSFMKQWIPRDVAQMIARELWENRWN
jgi:hypothetical protein